MGLTFFCCLAIYSFIKEALHVRGKLKNFSTIIKKMSKSINWFLFQVLTSFFTFLVFECGLEWNMSHFTVELRSQTSWSGPVLKTMRYISKLVIAIDFAIATFCYLI